ncbi:MAG: hypothetical protein ACU88J_07110 [Gammaproteobacteria bacterium]
MIILRDPQQLSQVVQPDIKTFLQQRFQDISDPEPYDPDQHGFFILVEPGDTSDRIESATGYSLLKSLFNGTFYGDPDFTPDCEYVEDHVGFYEAVFIFNDSGFAVVMIVPKEEGIDGRMLALCNEFATSHPEPLNINVRQFVSTLNIDAREYFEERAGIAEFEAGMSRAEAERFAMELTRAHFKLAQL